MKSKRLLALLQLLDGADHITADELARQTGVSLRTIYRDIDTLLGTGVPIERELGPGGGYWLRGDYAVRSERVDDNEAAALLVATLPEVVEHFRRPGNHVHSAQSKLERSMSQAARREMQRLRSRVHVDLPGWNASHAQPAFLELVITATLEDQSLRVRYKGWKGESHREWRPLGVVLKAGIWYVVVNADERLRTYRISRIVECEQLHTSFARPVDFDLRHYWQKEVERFDRDRTPDGQAQVRLSERGLRLVHYLGDETAALVLQTAAVADKAGWITASILIERVPYTAQQLLRLGPDVEVLEPSELRDEVHRLAESIVAIYQPKRGNT